MTYLTFRARSKDMQDGWERHIWGKQEYIDGGSIIKVAGTDSGDEEVAVLNIGGVSFNLPKDSDTEVFLLSSSSDTTLKMAILTIPRDKQRRWPEGEGGIQHPTDPEVSLHFSDKLTQVTKNKFAVGQKGEFEVKTDELGVFRVKKLIVDGELIVNKRVVTPRVDQGSEKPPDFDGNKQAEKTSGGGGGSGAGPTSITDAVQGVLDFGDAS
jgi:hypothetical protein